RSKDRLNPALAWQAPLCPRMRFTTGSHPLAGISVRALQRAGELGERNRGRTVGGRRPEKRTSQKRSSRACFRRLGTSGGYPGRDACSGKVSVDGREYDSYQYDFYRDSESARALYSHRSMLVEKASGIPFQNVSVSRRHVRQWVETRRYDPTLTIQAPPPES